MGYFTYFPNPTEEKQNGRQASTDASPAKGQQGGCPYGYAWGNKDDPRRRFLFFLYIIANNRKHARGIDTDTGKVLAGTD